MTRTARTAAVAAACLTFIALAAPGAARAQTVDYRVSAGYSTGSYIFSGTAWSAVMFHGLDVQAGRFRFSASVPIVAQNNTALTYIGGVIVPTGGPDDAAVAARRKGQPVDMGAGMGQYGQGATKGQGGPSGQGGQRGGVGALAAAAATDTFTVTQPGNTQVNVGDPVFTGDVALYRGDGLVRNMSVHAFAKAPVASVASGVSTGKWDYGGGASVSLGSARTFFFADASYWVLGDMPALELMDNVTYGLGLGQSLGEGRWSVLASASGSSQVIRNVDPPVSAGVSLGYRHSTAQSLTAGVNFGLTESAPKVSATIGWRILLLGTP